MGDARPGFGIKVREGGSEMAPQAIEIAQNGLADPAARNRWEGESIGRIPYHGPVKRKSS
jgi:hypothetical protein